MKKYLLLVLAAFAFAACTQNDVEELSANRQDVPETLTIGFEGGDDTRIQLNEAQKTVWTKDDIVSVFYRSNANQKWQYQGETGERVGDLKRVENAVGTTKTTKTIVVYPYSENYWLNTDSYYIDATLPAVQHYAEESYGVGDNLMVSQSEFTQFSLKSVCGWLKIQLTGNGERVTSLTLRGNNEEQLAGLIYVDTATAESTLASEMGSADDNNAGGNLVFDDAIVTELTLDCGEGVELGAEATAFYIALPPQTFEKGFNVEIVCADDTKMVKSSSNNVTIERNHIQPMAAIEFTPSVPNNQIWYTSSDGNVVTPNYADSFGVNIVSNTYIDGEGVITFDTDVTTIGDSAFNSCSSLISVTIPNSVTMIGDYAFAYCFSLTSVTIGDSVTTIGEGAFADCDSLTSVTIPDSVTTIRYAAFLNCDSLTNITIPDSVTTIGSSAFAYCTNLVEFNGKFASEDSRCLIVDGTLNSFAPAGLTSYTIPDSVTTIGIGAFDSCSSLTSITIPDSVSTIEAYAFSNCSSLTSIYCEATTPPSFGYDALNTNASERLFYVPTASVETYKTAMFWRDYADYIVGYDFENGVVVEPEVSINNEIRYTATAKVEAKSYFPWTSDTFGANIISNEWYSESGEGVITFDADVTTIGNYAFCECNSLTSLTIPDSVTTIGFCAFANCDSLTCITIPDSVTTIEDYAFCGCDNLTSVTIGNDVTTIGVGVFCECYTLTSVNIPNSITTIGRDAFRSCNSLTSITIPDSVTTIGEWAFGYCDSLTEFRGKYASEDGRCLIIDGVLTSFAPAGLTEYTVPDSIMAIGAVAFAGCNNLTKFRGKYASEDGRCLIIDGTLNAFAPAGITEYTIPNNVTKIGSHAFDGCSLTSITIPDSVTAIGDYAFEGCNSLTSIYCNATTPPSLEGSSVFNSYGSGCRIYVPLESFNIYRFAAGWSRYSAIIASIYPETGEIVEPIPFIGICGTFTGWGVSEDIGMKYLEERNLYVAYGIELNEDDEFKLRKDHGWDYNYGLEYDGAIYTNTYTTLAKNSHNIRVYQTGVYDIYFNADTLMFYLMEQGVDPNDAQYR